MRVIDPGHRFALACAKRGESHEQILQFYKDPAIHGTAEGRDGPICQEVIRALISRVGYLEKAKSAPENAAIIHHAREMLKQFELRAARLKLEKMAEQNFEATCIENQKVNSDGHILGVIR